MRVVGLLDDVPNLRYDTQVTPVVARLAPRVTLASLRANPDEVDRVFEIPFAALVEGERWEARETTWRGATMTNYHFRYDGEELWGLSAYVALMLLALMPGSRAPVPAWFRRRGLGGSVASRVSDG